MGSAGGDVVVISDRKDIESLADLGLDEEDGRAERRGRYTLARAVELSDVSGGHGRRSGTMGCRHVLVHEALAARRNKFADPLLLRRCLRPTE
eukprot:763066-Hanusia_phi.AAC.2